MKILKMRLENFQGVKELEIDPQGESSAIYGDNGTGKSTVYNAFTWLMYGKPSTTEKNYTPKTTGSHNLHHSVEMTVELADGSEMVLKKDYHEVYKTIKGNPQPVLSGHTTDYSMDGVPVSETQFKKNLLEIYHDEELAKMLTSYNYFLENMKVADRRKILLQVCGDADFNEVIESQGDLLRELPEMLRKPGKAENYYTVDEYRAIAAKEKNLTDKELDDIPQRIDEAEKAKPDVTGLDAQTIDNTMAEIKEKRRELESQRAARESGATTTIRQQIAELESQRAAGEAKHARAEAEANKGAYERISNLRYMASTIETDIMHTEQDKREHENEIQRLNRRREQLLAEWNEENEKEWSGSEICPTCGQQLPAEQIEEAKENFNTAKAQNLETINKRGMTECSSGMIKKEQDEIEALDARLVELKEKKAETAQNLATAEKAVLATTDYKDTAEYRQFTEQIESLQEKLKDARAAAAEADNVLRRPDLKNCKGLAPYELWEQAAQLTAQQNGNRSAGNGALMRTVYPGLYYTDESRAVEVADRIGRLTHWDDLSAEACQLYTKMVYYLIMHNADTVQKLCNGLNDITRGTRYSRKAEPANLNPSGFVVDSLHCALHCLRSTKNFEAAVVKAANLGGDTDTIAAITGGLAGALYGYEKIPLRWRMVLDSDTKSTLISLTGDAAKNHEEKKR